MTHLHHAGVCVRDMSLALQFYRDGLGLSVIADKVLKADLEPLLGVRTESVRTVFLSDTDHPDAGIVELLDLGVSSVADADAQAGTPSRGVFLLSFQVDVEAVLSRLERAGLGGSPRRIPAPRGEIVAMVTDPDGVMVELLPVGELSIMKSP